MTKCPVLGPSRKLRIHFIYQEISRLHEIHTFIAHNVPPLDYILNPLTPNDHYSGRTAPLTSKRCISYIYSTNIGTEYFKHFIYSSFFSLQTAVCFIIPTHLVPVSFTFYIQGVLKLKKNNSGSKRLICRKNTVSKSDAHNGGQKYNSPCTEHYFWDCYCAVLALA